MNPIPEKPEVLFRNFALAALVGKFQLQYGRFDSPKFMDREITYKRGAQQRVLELLVQEKLDKLIADGQFEAAKTNIKRACAGTFAGIQNNLLNQYDMLTITNAPAEELVTKLYSLLYGTGSFSPRFEAWVDLLARDKPSVWPTATYFLMMHDPSAYIFVKPEPFKKLLHALGSKIEWQTRPTAGRYAQIQSLGSTLLEGLAPMGANDMIDLQSFIYVMFPTKK